MNLDEGSIRVFAFSHKFKLDFNQNKIINPKQTNQLTSINSINLTVMILAIFTMIQNKCTDMREFFPFVTYVLYVEWTVSDQKLSQKTITAQPYFASSPFPFME